jgi:small GTP-binding protein
MASFAAQRKYKVVIVGMTNTGKTSIIRQFVDGVFARGNFPTVLPLADGVRFSDARGPYKVAIWDTAGAEEWISMNATAFRSPDAVIFVASYDLAQSLRDLAITWVPVLNSHGSLADCAKVLAMNKVDIADAGEDEVAEQDIEREKRELDARLFLVSAKDNRDIREMFKFVAGEVRKRDAPESGTAQEPKRGCC